MKGERLAVRRTIVAVGAEGQEYQRRINAACGVHAVRVYKRRNLVG